MEVNDIKELIREVSKSNIDTFSYEEGSMKIQLSKKKKKQIVSSDVIVEQVYSEPVEEQVVEETITGNEVKSPLVGTFYAAPSEDAEPFVSVGDVVKKGDVLAIVEAMKLMNEIPSEFDGVVKKICVENESPVEFGQVLFIIE